MVLPTSERQLEVLFGMLCGMTDKQIASRMRCSLKTLKRHKREVLALYQARRTNQLLAGLLPPQLRLQVQNRLAECQHVRQAAKSRRAAARGASRSHDHASSQQSPAPSSAPSPVPPVTPTLQVLLVNAGRVQQRPPAAQRGVGDNHGHRKADSSGSQGRTQP